MRKFLTFLSAHKFKIGLAFLFAAGGFERVGMAEVGYVLGVVAAYLMGAGRVASDREVRARQ